VRAVITGAVIAVRPNAPTREGKVYVDLYLDQPGERDLTRVWFESNGPSGLTPESFGAGQLVELDCAVFVGGLKSASGPEIAARVDAVREPVKSLASA
jgi:hypothetical protein